MVFSLSFSLPGVKAITAAILIRDPPTKQKRAARVDTPPGTFGILKPQ
jgi:hypothetical protein